MSKRDTRRVKVYKLINTGDWHDEGTGHVECVVIDKLDAPCIVVKSEVDETVILLQSKISGEDIYNKQQDTLIVWSESDPDEEDEVSDLALSFQDKEGCAEIWEEICDIQQTLRTSDIDLEVLFKIKDTDDFLNRTVTLPPANLGHIDEIHQLFTDCVTVSQKQAIASSFLKEQYLQKLVDLWRIIDDLASEEHYSKMYHIFKDIILLNSVPLLEQVVSPKYVMEIMAALEHDPERHIGTTKHSEFLRDKAVYKEIVPLNDTQLENKIHQTYRLQYLKDVALARTLDEPTFATINSLIFVNNIQIITELASNEEVLNALFTTIKTTENIDDIRDQLTFLAELCDLGKNLEPKNKSVFYTLLYKYGLLEIIEKTLISSDPKVRMTSVQILFHSVEHDADQLRSHITKQTDNTLFSQLVKRTDLDSETGVKILLFDVFRHLCDVSNVDEGMDKSMFLNLFYNKFASVLFSPLSRPTPKNGVHSEAESLLKNSLCELLSIFVQNHGQWVTNFLMNTNTIKMLFSLLNCNEKWLVLSAIRFFRALITVENNQYKNYIITENLFEPIVNVFLKNGSRYNLIESAILELFEWILKKNIKSIIKHIIENHYDKLKDVKYTEVFHKLKEQLEKNEFAPPTPEHILESTVFTDTTRQRFQRKFLEERKEEVWFDSDDGDSDDTDYIPNYKNDDIEEFTPRLQFKKRRIEGEELNLINNNNNNNRESPLKKQKKSLTLNGKEKSKERT